ncbi:hypothetical protein X777_03960, partial [Ooceraea biroi]
PPPPPTYQNLAAPAPFAPSAYNIRCAKIGKSTGGKKEIELKDRRAARQGGAEEKEDGRISVCPRGQTIYTAYEIYRKAS